MVVFALESITSVPKSTTPPVPPTHVVLAVVLQVREGALAVLLWERAREPFRRAWALPGGVLVHGETLEESILRHLTAKVDVREVAYLEQLATYSDPDRTPSDREVATAYLGLIPLGIDPSVPADTAWHDVDALPATAFDHRELILAGRDRLRAKLSYSNIGFALAPTTFTLAELREIYVAALGHEVSATNLKRVLLRRGVLESTGRQRAPGPGGGRPAEVFRFRRRGLEITDPFAALRPPG
jgi:ADP-ribose pyrophosphatase YjhB (NUDIX family)